MNLTLQVPDDLPLELRENEAMRFADKQHEAWTPHVPILDEQIVAIAQSEFGGRVTTEAFDRAGCGWVGMRGELPRCGQPYAAHTCTTRALIALKRDVTDEELHAFVDQARAWFARHGIEDFGVLPDPQHRIVG